MSADWIATLFIRELDGFERELLLFPDEAAVWRTVPGVTNSAGTLALQMSNHGSKACKACTAASAAGAVAA